MEREMPMHLNEPVASNCHPNANQMHSKKNLERTAKQFCAIKAKVNAIVRQAQNLTQSIQRSNPFQKLPSSGPQQSKRCRQRRKPKNTSFWRAYKEMKKIKEELLVASSAPSVFVPGTSYQHFNNVKHLDAENIAQFCKEESLPQNTEIENKNLIHLDAENINHLHPAAEYITHFSQEESSHPNNTEIGNKNLIMPCSENITTFGQEEYHSNTERQNKVEPELGGDNVQNDFSPPRTISECSITEKDNLETASFGIQTEMTMTTANKDQQTDDDNVKNKQHKMNDECQIFGDFIASELRNLNSDEDRKNLRRIILRNIVTVSESIKNIKRN